MGSFQTHTVLNVFQESATQRALYCLICTWGRARKHESNFAGKKRIENSWGIKEDKVRQDQWKGGREGSNDLKMWSPHTTGLGFLFFWQFLQVTLSHHTLHLNTAEAINTWRWITYLCVFMGSMKLSVSIYEVSWVSFSFSMHASLKSHCTVWTLGVKAGREFCLLLICIKTVLNSCFF